MKRAFTFILLSAFFACGASRAADAVTLAAQQEAEANYKRLTATIEEYATTQADQRKRIGELAAEVNKLRDELARNNNDTSTKESLRQLHEDLQKVDKARLADNERFKEALEKLGETIKKMPSVAIPKKPIIPDSSANPGSTAVGKITPKNNANTSGEVEEGFPYVVVSGDRPDKIAAKYQAEGFKVTAKSIIAANPNVDWSKLKIGDKLFIPKPK